MTQPQEAHVQRMIRQFSAAAYGKYEEGCKEHALEGEGNLWEVPDDVLIEHLMSEILDLWMYAATLREKLLRKAAASQT